MTDCSLLNSEGARRREQLDCGIWDVVRGLIRYIYIQNVATQF